MTYRRKLALTVVTGFLGSGKTTLLRRALAAAEAGHFAVVVNEAAETGLDASMVAALCARAVDVTGGCACCDRRVELVSTLKTIHDAHERGDLADLRHVVVETSGLADPLPIVSAIADDPVLRHHFVVRSVVAVVDGVEGMAALDHPEARRQLLSADRVLISKSDVVGPARVEELRARLRGAGSMAPIDVTADAWRDLFSRDTSGVVATGGPVDGHLHAAGVEAIALTFDRPVDWIAFGVWLSLMLHTHGRRVLRIKGIVPTDGLGGIAINSVRQMLYPPEHVDRDHRGGPTQLVVIAQNLDGSAIRRSLDAFQRIA